MNKESEYLEAEMKYDKEQIEQGNVQLVGIVQALVLWRETYNHVSYGFRPKITEHIDYLEHTLHKMLEV